ncbi:12223_t:CDS:10 [Ambispora gerdemannii]|uniref:12223_t:CDS:1 n=1 Tax=Ambispora gerdemannii TaxID=144530 RepID=A0A9N9GJQ2_9GLOM|nr:12223_t:CDS:10 [Ambispora gerdemannii]
MEYFKKTSPEKFRFLDFYRYRQKQDDFTRSFRDESGNLWRCLKSLVKDGTPQVKENATGVRLATEVPRRGNILPWLRRGVQPALWWFPVMFRNYCGSRSLICSPEKGYILAQLRQGVQPALWWFPVVICLHYFMIDVHIFWQQIENETSIDNAEITPQKLMLFKESVTYLPNHIKIDVSDEGMIIKDNHTSEEISGIIRNWLIMALTSPKEEFVKSTMTPLSSEASPKDCDFVKFAIELDCMREVKKIFPQYYLTIYQADGLGVRNSNKKEVVFIEILGGPENTDQKKLKEDSEKLLKEAVFGLVSLLRNYLDKSVEESKQLYTFMIQGIGDRLTLSKLCLINKHVYKISQIKSATLPFEFIDVADYLAVFEFLYILVSELEIQTGVINKLRLSESADGVIVPRIRDWIWLPDSISAWESELVTSHIYFRLFDAHVSQNHMSKILTMAHHQKHITEIVSTLAETEISAFSEKLSPEKSSEMISEESTETSASSNPTHDHVYFCNKILL